MFYRLGADALLAVHFLWIIFLVLGLPLGLYYRLAWLRTLHAAGLLLALALQLARLPCPFTIWEESLRRREDPGFSYGGSFIIAQMEKLVYPGWIYLDTVTVMTAFLVLATLLSFIFSPLKFKTGMGKRGGPS